MHFFQGLILVKSESFVEKPKLLSGQEWSALRNIKKKFYHQFPMSISDPNNCSAMPFSMSNRHNETSEFEAGCPGAVSG